MANVPAESPPGRPRWVKVTAIIVIVLILLVVGMALFGGEGHKPGPGRHGSTDRFTEQLAATLVRA